MAESLVHPMDRREAAEAMMQISRNKTTDGIEYFAAADNDNKGHHAKA